MTQYIVVGLGLAGIAFCEQLEKAGIPFIAINKGTGASSVSAGMYNSVILKRYTLAWNAAEQIELLHDFYQNLENKMSIELNHSIPVYRIFHSEAEQNQWFEATDKLHLRAWMSDTIKPNTHPHIRASFGYGELLHTGKIDVKNLIEQYRNYLISKNKLTEEEFNFDALQVEEDFIQYKNIKAQKIIFAEGFGLHKNPFFKQLPLVGNKGELLLVDAPDIQLKKILKSDIFILPEANNHYTIGTTYDFNDKTTRTTAKAKEFLMSKFQKIYSGHFKIIDHTAGVRPATIDRRPLLGTHPRFKNVAILNGLGTRGVMLAPYLSKMLLAYLEYDIPLNPEANIRRFKKIEW